MEVYMCKNDGIYSMTDQEPCHICDCKDWKPVDAQLLSPGDWKMMYEFAETPEEEFQIANAWAETGNPEAIRMRAMMLKNGAGCEADAKRAIEDIAHLAEKKDREAIFLLGCCYLAGDNVPADPMKGLSMLWQARDMKYPEAAWALAVMYDSGSYVAQDKKKAMKLFKHAAEMGSEMGMSEYGLRLFYTAKDEKQAELGLSWLWRSARAECGEAQAALGSILGQDSPLQDIDQSLYWLGRAVDNEVNGAAAQYATIWHKTTSKLGLDVEDKEEGEEIVQMLNEAMERGETSAACVLGNFSRGGIIIPQDFEQAFKYYRRGQGQDVSCTAGAAHCYLYGLGVEKNPGMAYLMLSDFIDIDGDLSKTSLPRTALIDLGDMYRDGIGVTQDSGIAASLYGLAAQRGTSAAATGRLCREYLSGNPNVSGITKEQALDMLDCAAIEDDFDSAFFLANYYLNAGDMEKAAEYMEDALYTEDERLDKPAMKLAEEKFPDILKGFLGNVQEDSEDDTGFPENKVPAPEFTPA